MKFSHISDVHLGGWGDERLTNLNYKAFKLSIKKSIERKVDFVLITGDLFDSAYPAMDTIEFAFKELRKLKDANMPMFFIKGSHDCSSTDKSFLNIIESSGLGINIHKEQDGFLLPYFFHKNNKRIALYGYPGKRTGREVSEIRKLKYSNSLEADYKILALHTTLDIIRPDLPIDHLETDILPKMDYYALGHIHERYEYKNIVYPSCTFPNSFSELEKLSVGAFVIHDLENNTNEFVDLNVIDIVTKTIDINDIHNIKITNNSLITLRLTGILGNNMLNFSDLDKAAREVNSILLVNHNQVKRNNYKKIIVSDNKKNENELINSFILKNPSKYNTLIPNLINSLSNTRKDGETVKVFEDKLLREIKPKLDTFINKETL